MDEIVRLGMNGSQAQRCRAAEALETMDPDRRAAVSIRLFDSPYKDIREWIWDNVEAIPPEIWIEAMRQALSAGVGLRQMGVLARQGILVVMQTLACDFPGELDDFARDCLDDEDSDVRYHAFCVAEMRRASGEEYEKRVKSCLECEDVDFRIIAIQAVRRLKPSWGCDAIKARVRYATGLEAFHARLALLHLCTPEERRNCVEALIPDILNDRYAFAAIEAVGLFAEYGSPEVIRALMSVAKGFFTEPTVGVAAAAAAARMGSADGLRWLQKCASSDKGNPEYARILLTKLGGTWHGLPQA